MKIHSTHLQSSSFLFQTVMCLTLSSFALGGCSPKTQSSSPSKSSTSQSSVSQKKTSSTSTPSKTSSPSSKLIQDGETYQVYYPQAALSSPSGQHVVKVIPKPGYKVNQDFPHRMVINPTAKLKFEQTSLTGSFTKKELAYTVKLQGEKGTHTVNAVADFSICNDAMCKLYRGTKLAWTAQISQ